MNTNLAHNLTETTADFTATHLALLQEFHDKAVAILRKDDPKMSELNAALTILIKVEKQRYYITHRRPHGQKRKHSSIIPFNPAEADNTSLPPESATANPPNPDEKAAKSAPSPASDPAFAQPLLPCHNKLYGYPNSSCPGCIGGACTQPKK